MDAPVAKKRLDQADSDQAILMRMVSMMLELIRGTPACRIHEDSAQYGTRRTESTDYDYDYDYD